MQLFISGTDTGVGKTMVTVALAEEVKRCGKQVVAWKPVETGCERRGNERFGADAHMLQAASSRAAPSTYALLAPLAPRVAAQLEGVAISIDRILEDYGLLKQQAGTMLVEGAGGLRVPLTDTMDMIGLARVLAMPVLLVGRAGLGTLNHVALSVEALVREQLPIAGIVLSKTPDVDVATAVRNQRELERMLRSTVHIFDGSASSAVLLAEALGLTDSELC
jgi:dethiobiotin synthetase